MKGDADILTLLNDVLTAELTAINQYFVHYKMAENWGYSRIAKKKRAESIEEMEHADKLIERILFFDGVPNMQRLNPVKVGEDVVEMHKLDLQLEIENRDRLNEGIPKCREKMDEGTRLLLEKILHDEEDAIDWLEAQLHQIEEIGKERYLAEQIHE